jgi:D-alanine-D-alanine ligase
MRVGLTYDLKDDYKNSGLSEEALAELDREDTIVGIEGAVQAAGHETVRIGSAPRLVERLARGERFDLVFNIAEGLSGAARESQVPAILDVYGIPYTFSDPLVLAVALHKGLAKHVSRAAGVPTADFVVVETLADLERVDLAYPLFVKPVAEGTSKGVTPASLVWDPSGLRASTRDLLEKFRQPVLVERYLSGREFTVGIVGTGDQAEVLGSIEVLLLAGAEQGIYSYENKQRWEGKVTYRVGNAREDDEVRRAESVALAAWRALGCRDAGRVDIRSDDAGQPCFIEVNPLAGLNPEISDLAILIKEHGIPYEALIRRILESAITRSRAAS